MAIKLKGVQCKMVGSGDDPDENPNSWKLFRSDIICGGVTDDSKTYLCWAWETAGVIVSRCKMAQADSVFMFFTAILVAGAAWLGWMRLKRGY